MSHTAKSTFSFPCAACGQAMTVPRLMAGGITRCGHCRRWMFAPPVPVSALELDRTQTGEDTVVGGLTPLTRTPPPPSAGSTAAPAREAVTLLDTARAHRTAGRLPEAVAAAAQARHHLTAAVREVDDLLADLRASLNALRTPPNPA
jgi:hypothetical protein